jgi:hypothetical protein
LPRRWVEALHAAEGTIDIILPTRDTQLAVHHSHTMVVSSGVHGRHCAPHSCRRIEALHAAEVSAAVIESPHGIHLAVHHSHTMGDSSDVHLRHRAPLPRRRIEALHAAELIIVTFSAHGIHLAIHHSQKYSQKYFADRWTTAIAMTIAKRSAQVGIRRAQTLQNRSNGTPTQLDDYGDGPLGSFGVEAPHHLGATESASPIFADGGFY